MKKVLFIFFLCLTAYSTALAEKSGRRATWDLKATLHYGYVLQHRPIITHLTYQHVVGIALNTERYFNLSYRHHLKFGVSTLYLDYRNTYVGKEYAVVPYFKIYFRNNPRHYTPVYRRDEEYTDEEEQDLSIGKYSFLRGTRYGIRLGAGAGYFSKTFDRFNNPQNLLISSHINGVLQGKFFVERKFGSKTLNMSIAFTHASNGAFKMPNYGVNVVSLSAGYGWTTGRVAGQDWYPDSSSHKVGDQGLILETGIGLKEVFPTGGKKYMVNTLAVVGYKNVSNVTSVLLGLDAVYNRALLQEQIKSGIEPGEPDVKQFGIAPGVEFDLGKISWTVQYGVNFYRPFAFEGRTYTKLGAKYNFYENYSMGIRLKANGGKADFVELTMHYRL